EVAPNRALLTEGEQKRERQNAGDGGAGDGQEYRIEILHGDARRRQRSAENEDADHPVDKAAGHPVHRALLPRALMRASGERWVEADGKVWTKILIQRAARQGTQVAMTKACGCVPREGRREAP